MTTIQRSQGETLIDVETLKELLRRTALGDEDAIGELAGQIGGMTVQGVTAQGVSDYVKAQIKANAAAERYARNYQDIEADDELRAKARKLDNEMARRHPEMNLDVWARGHGKTSIITFAGAIQEIIRDPEITIGLFSHTSSTAKAFLSQHKRELESNDDLKVLFPEVFYAQPEKQSPSWSVDNGLIVMRKGNPKEATIEAHGLVDGQPTSKHYRRIIYDDVVTERSVGTED